MLLAEKLQYYKYPLFLNNSSLSSNEKLVAIFIYDFLEKSIHKQQKNARKEYYVYINQEYLANKLSLSRQTVSKILIKLEKLNLLIKEKIKHTLTYRYYLLNQKREVYSEKITYSNTKFIKIYHFLFDAKYKDFQNGERLLLAFLWDTQTLSEKNVAFFDWSLNESFIIKKQKELSKFLNCSLRTINSYFSKLKKTGIIQYKRLGKTLANHTYLLKEKILKRFTSLISPNSNIVFKNSPTNSFYFNQSDVQKLKSDVQKFNIYKTKNNQTKVRLLIKKKDYNLTKVKEILEKRKNRLENTKKPLIKEKSKIRLFEGLIKLVHKWWNF